MSHFTFFENHEEKNFDDDSYATNLMLEYDKSQQAVQDAKNKEADCFASTHLYLLTGKQFDQTSTPHKILVELFHICGECYTLTSLANPANKKISMFSGEFKETFYSDSTPRVCRYDSEGRLLAYNMDYESSHPAQYIVATFVDEVYRYSSFYIPF